MDVMKECDISERELSRSMDAEAIGKLALQGMTATYPDKQEFMKAGSKLYAQWEGAYIKPRFYCPRSHRHDCCSVSSSEELSRYLSGTMKFFS